MTDLSSPRRKPGSSDSWVPAFAGMTENVVTPGSTRGPGLRLNGDSWVPAFAGMTEQVPAFAGMTDREVSQ
ncbi:MAG: hypothetical protein WCU88_09675 [Elusimicrobiota bacterium]|jgi:hypothetical protein